MISLHPLSFPQLYAITKDHSNPLFNFWLKHGDDHFFKRIINRNRYSALSTGIVLVRAVEKDSQQYEIDPDKAREALQQLDQQLQDLSKKQVSPPKTKASDVRITRRDEDSGEEVAEISGASLAVWTAALFLFTIFYNILYITVIEPSINGT